MRNLLIKLPSVFLTLILSATSYGLSLNELSSKDANSGLKAALEQGASTAVAKLGVDGGFLNNDKVKIRLPEKLEKVRPLLKMAGQSKKLDELELSMNQAAEKAVPLAKPLLLNAIKSMTLSDAKKILSGGDTSVTDFFREKTEASLNTQFLPTVKNVTDKTKLAANYNSIVAKAKPYGVVPEEASSVETYVTKRALDGLYLMIAEEEKAIRKDPVGTGVGIIQKVFGVLK